MLHSAPACAAIGVVSFLAIASCSPRASADEQPGGSGLVFSCAAENDLFRVLAADGATHRRFSTAAEAIRAAGEGAGVLILADGYPQQTTVIDPALFAEAARKRLRLYLEYPAELPGLAVGLPQAAQWRRGVVASDAFGPTLPRLRIVMLHDCHFVPVVAEQPHLVIARVAGFHTAVFGLSETEVSPLLFEHPQGGILVATTKLSQFLTARYAPTEAWQAIWQMVLQWLQPGKDVPAPRWTSVVRPTYGPDERLPDDVELQALRRGAGWYFNARLLVHPAWEDRYEAAGKLPDRLGPMPQRNDPIGNGSLGVLEGFHARVDADGTQPARWWRRADCTGETAGALALAAGPLNHDEYPAVAKNLLDFLLFTSIQSQGERAEPQHPAYGLLGWNDVPRYWGNLDGYGVYYGDDNARAMLGAIAAAAVLKSDRWDERLAKCLLGNVRTTGRSGFRHDRFDEGLLEQHGWRHFFEEEHVSCAPHYQAYVWACYLWAYRATGEKLFLERTRMALRTMMEGHPDQWRWVIGTQPERARMLLPLAWLVRLEDTPEHRRWLATVADALLADQDNRGAIRDRLGPNARVDFAPPRSNKEYGSSEAPLIQNDGDPACDLLYSLGFALLGLHEAAAATGEARYREAEDRLAKFLCRIQVRSEAHPELDGAWFRAFDFQRWEYWASNGDAGWGAWSVESGWSQAWIVSVLALRRQDTSLWELTAGSKIAQPLLRLRGEML